MSVRQTYCSKKLQIYNGKFSKSYKRFQRNLVKKYVKLNTLINDLFKINKF